MSVTQPSVAIGTRSGRTRTRVWTAQDVAVVLAVTAAFCVIAALTWRKWGSPEIDAGAELTAADRVSHGAVPYRDFRYFYGPLGLYELAAAFRVFGTSFAVAFAFGLAQTAAILGAFYALARQWLRPPAAGISTAVLVAIAFSGTAFDFVLPHTNSATTGILCVLLELLALARGRLWLAGAAAGLVCLTRPEFALVSVVVAAAYLAGTWRESGRPGLLGKGLRLALPAAAIPVSVLGAFAALAGAHRLFFEDLWPVDFIRIAGFRSQSNWMPFTLGSGAGLVARGLVYAGLLAALVSAVVVWRDSDGGRLRRLRAFVPPLAVGVVLIGLDGCARLLDVLSGQRAAIELECRHLLIGMSWLPCLALVVGGLTAWRFVRAGRPPFSSSWALDAALAAAAAGLALRAYNAFTAEGSYAPYYAAPAVLLAGILHQRIAERWSRAAVPALAALGVVALGLAAYSLVGLYPDDTTTVHTARGAYVENARAAAAVQAVVETIRADTEPQDRILVAPSDAGLYFMSGRVPALADLMVLPGLLATTADERAAIAKLQEQHVSLAVVGARDFSAYGFRSFGIDYDPVLARWLDAATVKTSTIGVPGPPASGTYASTRFRVLRLRS